MGSDDKKERPSRPQRRDPLEDTQEMAPVKTPGFFAGGRACARAAQIERCRAGNRASAEISEDALAAQEPGCRSVRFRGARATQGTSGSRHVLSRAQEGKESRSAARGARRSRRD